MPSAARFLRQLLLPWKLAVVREETSYRRGGERLAASLYRPAVGGSPLPGWVALHGLTHRGRDHESLDAFARALAASGALVLVPDIPEWRALRVAPAAAQETVRSAVVELNGRPATAPGRVGVIGFSFGGTQALVASTDPALEGRLSAVASWGAYAELDRAARYLFLGDHDLDGQAYRVDPDPYGRWILAGNYLPLVPGHRQDRDLARALLGLAREVGRRAIMAWDPETDPLKAEARQRLGGRERELFDLLAPPTGTTYSSEERVRVSDLVDGMSAAVIDHEPLLDAGPYLQRVPVPVFLAHGREDRLMPWTELIRIRRALPEGLVRDALVTRLYAHSFRERRFPTPMMLVEAFRFVLAINRMVRLV